MRDGEAPLTAETAGERGEAEIAATGRTRRATYAAGLASPYFFVDDDRLRRAA